MFKELSSTELQIMEVLWNSKEAITPSDLLQFFNNHKERSWKRQTISTFLSRLCDKDLLIFEKKGREVFYQPKYTKSEYEQNKAKGFLASEYQGSIKNFMTALYSDSISQEELDELKDWLNNK